MASELFFQSWDLEIVRRSRIYYGSLVEGYTNVHPLQLNMRLQPVERPRFRDKFALAENRLRHKRGLVMRGNRQGKDPNCSCISATMKLSATLVALALGMGASAHTIFQVIMPRVSCRYVF